LDTIKIFLINAAEWTFATLLMFSAVFLIARFGLKKTVEIVLVSLGFFISLFLVTLFDVVYEIANEGTRLMEGPPIFEVPFPNIFSVPFVVSSLVMIGIYAKWGRDLPSANSD
jgi:hypothetical protein